VWVEFSYKGTLVTAKSSGIEWKAHKSFTVRKRDTPSATGGVPSRYRTSFFLLFEPTASKSASGLWDAHEKLSLARVMKDEVVPKAVEIFKVDPQNDGQDPEMEEEEETMAPEDIGDDTSEEEDDDEEEEEEESDEDDEPKSMHAKAEAAAKKRKTKGGEGLMKKLGARDPCVMFVLFIMAANLLVLPISWIIDM